MPSPNKIKRVRGWAVVSTGLTSFGSQGSGIAYQDPMHYLVFVTKTEAMDSWKTMNTPVGATVVPCEITYSLPKKGKK